MCNCEMDYDKIYEEIIKRLGTDPQFFEHLRDAFLKTLDTTVSLKVHIETDKKRCPICNSGMILRASKQNGGYFWGCANYPRCKGLTQATDAEVADYAEKYSEQFEILKAQSDLYKKEQEEAGEKGYDSTTDKRRARAKKNKKDILSMTEDIDSRDAKDVLKDLLDAKK